MRETFSFHDESRYADVEEFLNHPLLVTAGRNDHKSLKGMIRQGLLSGHIDSRGEASTSLLNIRVSFYLLKLKKVLEMGFIDASEEDEFPTTDFNVILLTYLAREVMDVPELTVGKLRQAMSA